MNLIVHKTLKLQGSVVPPASKSQAIRALLMAVLSEGQSELENMLDSEDTRDAITVCQCLGAEITAYENKLIIRSSGLPLKPRELLIQTGNSGITTRFFMPILGLRQQSSEKIILDCSEQMRARPMIPLIETLRQLGLSIEYHEKSGVLPVSITGNLKGGKVEIAGVTSQYLSALLMALPLVQEDSEITVENLHERPYVEMTLHWLEQQNIQYTHQKIKNRDIYKITGRQKYTAFKKVIPSDFSSASYLITAAALLKGSVELEGVDMQDPQGDKRLVYILQEMGADIYIEPQRLSIQGGKPLKGIKIDANDIPDLLPVLAVIGTQAAGKTEIGNVAQARIKETDRIHAMTEGLRCLGVSVEEYQDGMTVYPSTLQGGKVSGYGDHRTVMALSVAGMLSTEKTIIQGCEAINKTFPDFIKVMQSLGARMEVCDET